MGMYSSRRHISRLLRQSGLPYVRSARRNGLLVIDGGTRGASVVITARCQYGDTIEAMGAEAKDEAEMSAAAEAAVIAAGYTIDRLDGSTFSVTVASHGVAAPPTGEDQTTTRQPQTSTDRPPAPTN